MIYHKTGQSAILSCTINPWCSADDWEYEWFSFQENFYFRLTPLENHHKYTLHGANLHIHSLVTNDSGIYHCAAASRGEPARGKQHVGLGTTLVVRGKTEHCFLRLGTDNTTHTSGWVWIKSFSFFDFQKQIKQWWIFFCGWYLSSCSSTACH